jgi:hypothetical protein
MKSVVVFAETLLKHVVLIVHYQVMDAPQVSVLDPMAQLCIVKACICSVGSLQACISHALSNEMARFFAIFKAALSNV